MFREQKVVLMVVIAAFALVVGRTSGQRQGSCSGVRDMVPAVQGELTCTTDAKPVHDRGEAASAVEKGEGQMTLTAQKSAVYARTTTRSYQETLSAVQEAAKAAGFRIPGVMDLAASMRKEGIEREPYAVVELCNAQIASDVLKVNPMIGTLMPCRIAVYQQGSQTVVAMALPSKLMELFPESDVAGPAKKVDQALRGVIDAATK
jgi:uncharacterized protein (DUF302 family)